MTQHSKVRMFRNKSTLQTIHRIRTELSLGVLGFYSTHFESANEWVVSNQILVFAQRFLGLPWDKHCKLLEGNIWWKVVLRSKKMILEIDQHFLAKFLSEMD